MKKADRPGFWGGRPPLRVVEEGDVPPEPCPRCGRLPQVVRLVYDPDFYGNADRLRELTV